MFSTLLLVTCAWIAQAQPAPPSTPPTPQLPAAGYVPERVYDSRAKAWADFEVMLAALTAVDVAFVGEQHDDPNTHALERAILEGLARRGRAVMVSLEMFERDVQSALDGYLAGRVSEEAFLKDARPWPRYTSDYRPLVELAKARGWPVVAANVPRRYAAQVGKTGLATLSPLPEAERVLIGRDIECPHDRYFERFAEEMASHPMPGQKEDELRETTARFYEAQCIKDETMAESIAGAMARAPRPVPLIVHFNGAFHSDYAHGTAARTTRRLPNARIRVVSIIPVDDLDTVRPEPESERGDFVIFTLQPAGRGPGTGDRGPGSEERLNENIRSSDPP